MGFWTRGAFFERVSAQDEQRSRLSGARIDVSSFATVAILAHIEIPAELQRNAPKVLAAGVEHTGEVLLRNLADRIGRADLVGLDLLDLGCGVRFAQTLINRALPFNSYTGIDVDRPLVEWLINNVEAQDARFRFAHWDVHNAMYNRGGVAMQEHAALPVAGDYDVITGYSLFTHLAPDGARHLLRLARKAVRASGWLLFSAFTDEAVNQFEDRVAGQPLLQAYYHPGYLREMLAETGWEEVSFRTRGEYIQSSFLCRPAPR